MKTEPRKRRTGCIYEEETNDGKHRREGGMASVRYVRGVGCMTGKKRRWMGEITVNRKRYRFRSTNLSNVQWWVRSMVDKYGD